MANVNVPFFLVDTIFFESRCFPRMRSEGFSCYFGGLGVETCSLDAAMPSTTIRASDRSEGLVAIPMASAGDFWRFETSCNVLSRGRCGTSRHPHVFDKALKVVLCDRRTTFAKLSEDELHFSWHAQHFTRQVVTTSKLRGRRRTS